MLRLPKLERRPELDALRGLFLVWMTLTHLPTRFSDFVNQPIGYVTSAEGFVLISALLVGRLYIRELMQDAPGVRHRLWRRSLKIYAYHLIMLALAFTVAASYAVHAHKPAITHLLNFYLSHPVVAIVGGILLIYCPPLLDILPMYVTFLFLTPMMLSAAVRFGWAKLLIASGLVWLLAQFGLRYFVHNWIVHLTHLPIPLQETGAFNQFAWQALWIAGLWLGARSATHTAPFTDLPRWAGVVSFAVCLFFIGVRHSRLGAHLTPESLGILLDKWQIGPLRALNLIAFIGFCFWLRKYLAPLVRIEPFPTLGKASLRVFCAHIFFVFIGLALIYGDVDNGIPQLHGFTAFALLLVTFASLLLVALFEVRRKRLSQPPRPALEER
jgi:hypothetical protein